MATPYKLKMTDATFEKNNNSTFGDGGFSRIPAWDGSPATWRRYKRAVEIWLEGENLEVPYSIAARMVQKLTGTARNRADLIPLEKLRPIRPRPAVAAVAAGCGPLIRIVASQALARLWLSTVAQHWGEPRIGTAQISLKLAAVFDALVSHNM